MNPSQHPELPPLKLTRSERNAVADILSRRASDIADFSGDLRRKYERVQADDKYVGPRMEIPGSIELSFMREINRLRDLAEKIRVPESTEDEEEE